MLSLKKLGAWLWPYYVGMISFLLVDIELHLDHSLLSSDRAGVLSSVFMDIPDDGRGLCLRGQSGSHWPRVAPEPLGCGQYGQRIELQIFINSSLSSRSW